MRLSYNWLTELLPALTHAPEEVAELLTLHSFETIVAGRLDIDHQISVARITQLLPHPNADRLQLATVEAGDEQSITVVCGAPNIAVGNLVPYAPPGARLMDDAGQPFTLREATIRGQVSPGMLCSPRELGLGSHHTGIYLLPPETPVGSRLQQHLPADVLLEADVTPNRAHDCMSHLGVARELAALLQQAVQEPAASPLPASAPPGWDITIADPHDTPRYLGIPMSSVRVTPSPLWLQARLFAVGQRPINNVVDITNYVMFEQGNPSHAFAADKLPAHTIAIRRAKTGELLTTLDGKQQQLQPRHLIIASSDIPIALAGVMGGSSTEVSATTRELLLEVANFRSYAIQQASGELRLITESSKRFARGLPAAAVEAAAARTATLLAEIAGAEAQGIIDCYPQPARRSRIRLKNSRVSAAAGVPVAAAESAAILQRLRCTVETGEDGLQVTPPLDRLDLAEAHDLVEEIIRVRGLNQIPAASLMKVPAAPLPRSVAVRERLRDHLVQAGCTEVYNRPFEQAAIARALNVSLEKAVALANPMGPEQAYLRASLLPRLVENLMINKGEVRLKKSSRSRNLFEVGTVWHTGRGGAVPGIVEEEYLAGVIVDELDAPELLHDLLQTLGLSAAPGDATTAVGVLPPPALANLKLPPHIQFFTLNLTQLLPHLPDEIAYVPAAADGRVVRYQPVSKYPPAYRDISLLVAPGTPIERVQEIIERAGGELVADVDLFDVYDGEEKTSYAFHIKYQAPNRTLTDDEVAAAQQRINAALVEEVAAEIR